MPTLIRVETAESTQDLVHRLAQEGAPAGTAVVAQVQTRGRGSRGRAWASPGGGLWLSVLCRPPHDSLAVLSLRVGLAAAVAVEAYVPGIRVGLKWPNDLYLGDRKLGGVLCEAKWHSGVTAWVAVGLGLNITNPIPAELAEVAVTLAAIAPGADPARLELPLVNAIAAAGRREGTLDDAERAAYALRDWLFNRELGLPVSGIARGIAADGALLVEAADGRLAPIRHGTVVLTGV